MVAVSVSYKGLLKFYLMLQSSVASFCFRFIAVAAVGGVAFTGDLLFHFFFDCEAANLSDGGVNFYRCCCMYVLLVVLFFVGS